MSRFPLTNFLIALGNATPEQIRRANPEKMAAKYGISVEHCKMYLDHELTMKGGQTVIANERQGQLL